MRQTGKFTDTDEAQTRGRAFKDAYLLSSIYSTNLLCKREKMAKSRDKVVEYVRAKDLKTAMLS